METFQGRRIVTREVDGEEVEVIEGLEFRAMVPKFSFGPSMQYNYGFQTMDVRPPKVEHVQIVEPVYLHYGAAAPDDPLYPQQWGLPWIHAEAAWDAYRGDPTAVVLAVLDTGIPMENGKPSHPDLSGDRFICGEDMVNRHEARDDHGHGTHVTGIAAATRNNATGMAGLWPGVVHVVKVFDSRNHGSDETFAEGIEEALSYAKKFGVRMVINYSGCVKVAGMRLRGAVERVGEEGALLVCAAGNERGGKVRYPAALADDNKQVIGVGATDRKGALSALSSKGGEITLCAPGEDILSTLPNYHVTCNTEDRKATYYDRFSGTSMACPLVAGVAALVWSQKPSAEAGSIRDHLLATAQSGPPELGCGIIDAGKALETPL